MKTAWVVESGEYEERSIDGIYESLKSAISGIKGTYGFPYIVKWVETKDLDNILIGNFDAVPHYSTKHTRVFYIAPYPVGGGNPR